MKYVTYNIKKHDSSLLVQYLKTSLKHLLLCMQNNIIKIFDYCLPNKFLRFMMLLPMTLVLLSGFIHEEEPPFSKTFPLYNKQVYPLVEDYLPVIYAPRSAMIPMNHQVSSFFKQYAPHDVPGYLHEHARINEHSTAQTNNLPQLSLPLLPSEKAHLEQVFIDTLSPIIFEDKHAKISEINLILPQKQLDPHNAPQSYARRKNSYSPFIHKYAKQYSLDPKLVTAIVYAESMFMPHLVSSRNAHGLMQVVPETAGAEVHKFFKKEGIPTASELIQPETNIRYGTAYLYLLRRYHLTGIYNTRSKDLITIASYNAGSGAVLRHFGTTKMEAIENINAMNPDEIYESILLSFRSSETRRYLAKVTEHMDIL